MDVESTVGNVGLVTAFFALLAALALAVELGESPKLPRASKERLKGKTRKGAGNSSQHEESREAEEINPADIEKTVATAETENDNGPIADAAVKKELSEAKGTSLTQLRASFVDGFSCNRDKYDIAITVLHETQKTDTKRDGGATIAAEAYLSATHSLRLAHAPINKPAEERTASSTDENKRPPDSSDSASSTFTPEADGAGERKIADTLTETLSDTLEDQ